MPCLLSLSPPRPMWGLGAPFSPEEKGWPWKGAEWAAETKTAVGTLPESGRWARDDSSLGEAGATPGPCPRGHLAEKEPLLG